MGKYPDKFRSIIVFITNRCRVFCASCNTAATPDSTQHLSPEWIRMFLGKISPVRQSRYIIWTGGEPFMAFDTLQAGISLSHQKGFSNEVLTSGEWFRKTPERLGQLAESGPFSLRISIDAEHQKTVPFETIDVLIDETIQRRIPVGFTLRSVPGYPTTPEEMKERILHRHPELEKQKGSTRLFHIIPTIPDRVSSEIKVVVESRNQSWDGPCRLGFRDLIVGADGKLYPCCGLFGLGVAMEVNCGDPLESVPSSPEKLVTGYDFLEQLRDRGPATLARESGLYLDQLKTNHFANQCHLCRSIVPEWVRQDR